MTIGSLFSGIGGFELGFERAGFGPVVWQAESDPWCRRVLERHWPRCPRFSDVRAIGARPRAQLILAGFPCQDLSHAGSRAGLAGERSGLVEEVFRVVEAQKPEIVVVENIHHAWRSWVPAVRTSFVGLGYATIALRVSASDLGACHERRRAFVVAHADGEFLRDLSRRWSGQGREMAAELGDPRWRSASSRMARRDDGLPFGLDRRRALGNAVVPQCAELVGRVILATRAAPSGPEGVER